MFHSVLEQIERGNEHLLGLMLESHLEAGDQALSETISPSISLTSCLHRVVDDRRTDRLNLTI